MGVVGCSFQRVLGSDCWDPSSAFWQLGSQCQESASYLWKPKWNTKAFMVANMVPVTFMLGFTGFKLLSSTLFQLVGSSSECIGGGGRVYGRCPRAAAGPGAARGTAPTSTFWWGALLLNKRTRERMKNLKKYIPQISMGTEHWTQIHSP